MCQEQYNPDCEGCKISQKLKIPRRGEVVIDLPGDWTLNHYGSSEGFLGWLALQPRYHRMELKDLSPNEAAALGGNIQDIDIALRQYWSIHFEDDPIERVYVVYFFEGVFDEPKPDDEPKPELYHLHIHLIPRTKQFGRTLRDEDGSIVAWKIYTLRKEMKRMKHTCRPEYGVNNEEDPKDAVNLMTYLSGFLWRLSGAK